MLAILSILISVGILEWCGMLYQISRSGLDLEGNHPDLDIWYTCACQYLLGPVFSLLDHSHFLLETHVWSRVLGTLKIWEVSSCPRCVTPDSFVVHSFEWVGLGTGTSTYPTFFTHLNLTRAKIDSNLNTGSEKEKEPKPNSSNQDIDEMLKITRVVVNKRFISCIWLLTDKYSVEMKI